MTDKNLQEEAVFTSFLEKLRTVESYEQFLADLSYKPSDSPDIEIELKNNSPKTIGLEITRYLLDGKLVKNKKIKQKSYRSYVSPPRREQKQAKKQKQVASMESEKKN